MSPCHACSSQAAEGARKESDGRAKEAEKELEERREEVRVLEDRLRKAEEESSHSKTRLDSFTKAMGSLQDDRDRVLSMYKQLEEKHLQVVLLSPDPTFDTTFTIQPNSG